LKIRFQLFSPRIIFRHGNTQREGTISLEEIKIPAEQNGKNHGEKTMTMGSYTADEKQK